MIGLIMNLMIEFVPSQDKINLMRKLVYDYFTRNYYVNESNEVMCSTNIKHIKINPNFEMLELALIFGVSDKLLLNYFKLWCSNQRNKFSLKLFKREQNMFNYARKCCGSVVESYIGCTDGKTGCIFKHYITKFEKAKFENDKLVCYIPTIKPKNFKNKLDIKYWNAFLDWKIKGFNQLKVFWGETPQFIFNVLVYSEMKIC